jgi:general secretion pathway protein J
LNATSSPKGFTLLEILIALVLLAILTTALYGSYFAVVRARDRASEGMEARRELGATLDLLRREIASAKFINNAVGIDKRLRFVVEDRDFFGKPASNLELTTLAPPGGQGRKESGVLVVHYRMVEKDRKLVLVRQEQDIFSEATDIPSYPQMENITSFLVECSNDGLKWVKTWDASLNNGLPQYVRITVQFDEGGKPQEFSVYAAPKMRGT